MAMWRMGSGKTTSSGRGVEAGRMNALKARRGQGGPASRRRESTSVDIDPPKRRGGGQTGVKPGCADAPREQILDV